MPTRKDYFREYYDKNREKIIARAKAYYHENKNSLKKFYQEQKGRGLVSFPVWIPLELRMRIKQAAKEANIPMYLYVTQILEQAMEE